MNNVQLQSATFILGNYYLVYGRYCQFIKVTPKGFNFIDISNYRCMFTRHFYDKRYGGKPMPSDLRTIKTIIPACYQIYGDGGSMNFRKD